MVGVLGFLTTIGPALGQSDKGVDLSDPVEILRKASDVVKSTVLQYKTTVQPFGVPTPRDPRMEGTVLMSQFKVRGPAKFKYDIALTYPDASGESRITIGSDGRVFYLLNHDEKKAYEGFDHRVFGVYAGAMETFPVDELIRPVPYDNLLVSGTLELRGVKQVRNEDCYEVFARFGQAKSNESLWFFSKKTFQLLRVDIASQRTSEVRLGRQVMISDMILNPKFDHDPFAFQLPPGYEKVGTKP